MAEPRLCRLQVLGAALLFSTGGAAIKGCALGAWQVAGLRSLVAALALWAFLPAARRGWSWRSLVVGSAYAATLILFVSGNKLTTAAATIRLALDRMYLSVVVIFTVPFQVQPAFEAGRHEDCPGSVTPA